MEVVVSAVITNLNGKMTLKKPIEASMLKDESYHGPLSASRMKVKLTALKLEGSALRVVEASWLRYVLLSRAQGSCGEGLRGHSGVSPYSFENHSYAWERLLPIRTFSLYSCGVA